MPDAAAAADLRGRSARYWLLSGPKSGAGKSAKKTKQGPVSKFVTHFHPQPAGQGAEVDLPGEGSQKHAPRALAPGIR